MIKDVRMNEIVVFVSAVVVVVTLLSLVNWHPNIKMCDTYKSE